MSRFHEQERRLDSGATDEIHVLTALRVQSTASSRERTHKLDGAHRVTCRVPTRSGRLNWAIGTSLMPIDVL